MMLEKIVEIFFVCGAAIAFFAGISQILWLKRNKRFRPSWTAEKESDFYYLRKIKIGGTIILFMLTAILLLIAYILSS